MGKTSNSDAPPPRNFKAEQSVLGSILLSPKSIAKITDILTSDAFYDANHKTIYTALLEMWQDGIAIDIITLAEKLYKNNILDEVGGIYYLTELSGNTPTAANILQHALIVKDRHIERQVLHAAQSVIYHITTNAADIYEETTAHQRKLFEITSSVYSTSNYNAKDAAMKSYDSMLKIQSGREGIISSGFESLDEHLNGFYKSDLIVIGARTSIGKTRLMTSMMVTIGMLRNQPIGIISIEMPVEQIVWSMKANWTKIDMRRFRQREPNFTDEENKKILAFYDIFSKSNIYIDDAAYVTIDMLMSKARQFKEAYGIKILFVDYLQRIATTNYHATRHNEISEVSGGLKRIAKELEISVVVLAQLSRKTEERLSKKPILSDLKESGDIEQDADVVLLMHRPAFYNKDFENNEISKSADGVHITKLYVAKNRNGPANETSYLHFYLKYGLFLDKGGIEDNVLLQDIKAPQQLHIEEWEDEDEESPF